MQQEPEDTGRAMEQRRHREVHKIRLAELSSLSSDDIARMVRSGDIELMVRREDLRDLGDGGWGNRVAKLFQAVASGLSETPSQENRTIFVNIVGGAPERAG